jgi:hypothetical protein
MTHFFHRQHNVDMKKSFYAFKFPTQRTASDDRNVKTKQQSFFSFSFLFLLNSANYK